MNSLYEFEDIEDYLHDRMSESDRVAFEQALETDANLVNRVEALKAEKKVLRLLRNEYLLEQFAVWENEEDDKKKSGSPDDAIEDNKIFPFYKQGWWLPFAAAASIVGLIAVGWLGGWFKGDTHQPSIVSFSSDTIKSQPNPIQQTQKEENIVEKETNNSLQSDQITANNSRYAPIAESTFLKEDFSETLMGSNTGDSAEDNYSKAVDLYSTGQYKAALNLLEHPDSAQLQEYLYLRGYTYYQLKKYSEAERDFHAFRGFQTSDRKVDAIWREVFCMTRQLPASRSRLDAVLREITVNPRHNYYKRAIKLQNDLKAIK